ncbi:MAG: hypothetical protein J0L57_18035 [Burkholderiales bacterium]|nr:hypothetical protein [Burkholderiales bacterium]
MEARRNVGAEILQSIKDMKAGKGKVVLSPAVAARQATGLRPVPWTVSSSRQA